MIDMHELVTLYAVVAALCWILTGLTATIAVFSSHIDDTVMERIGLGLVAISCVAAAWNILEKGQISDLVLFVSVSFGFYAATLLWKHRRCFGTCAYRRG